PNAHADLTLSLIRSVRETFGESGMGRLIAARTRSQIADYGAQVPRQAPLGDRLRALAALRNREGYMAEVIESDEEGEQGRVFLPVDTPCPLCVAAAACTTLCAGELQVFQAVLGADVAVERVDHILAGARRCAYRVARFAV